MSKANDQTREKVVLTADQQTALDQILNFFHKGREVAAVLSAAAGCGKTFLTRVICDALRNTRVIAGVAPTHKARKVIEAFLNYGEPGVYIKTFTVASILNTMRAHSYIGTKRFERGNGSKMSQYEILLIDEASMITDSDVQVLIRYAGEFGCKLLFIGDPYQIPNPSQKYKIINGHPVKKDSCAFDLPIHFKLTTIVRQKTGNPLIKIYAEIRDAITEGREPQIAAESDSADGAGVFAYTDYEQWYAKISETYRDLVERGEPIHRTRVLVYTNDAVKGINDMIRKLYNRGDFPEAGELLMGYGNVGWPDPIIENSQDYYVKEVRYTTSHIILVKGSAKTMMKDCVFSNLVGHVIVLNIPGETTVRSVFSPDLKHDANKGMLAELVYRAERVNKPNSTKTEFKQYFDMKNSIVIMESVYKIGDLICGESEFKSTNVLLYRPVTEYIRETDDGRAIIPGKLSDEVKRKYGGILEDRIGDDKPIIASEKLCDKYCIIEKDLDYGYCITSHKSQGSSFDSVFIDNADFDKLKPFWSYQFDSWIDPMKERNQLKYVAYTRPKYAAHIIFPSTNA